MIIVIIDVAILVAAKNFVCPKLPINPVSIIPAKGIAKLEKNIGIERKKIFFFVVSNGLFLMIIFKIQIF